MGCDILLGYGVAMTTARDVFWDNVHKVNCCPEHGCIWGHDDCPVVTGIVKRYGEKCPRCEDSARELLHPGYEAERPEPPPLPAPGQYSTPAVPLSGECSYRELPPIEPIGDRIDRVMRGVACSSGGAGLAIGFALGLLYAAYNSGVLTS